MMLTPVRTWIATMTVRRVVCRGLRCHKPLSSLLRASLLVSPSQKIRDHAAVQAPRKDLKMLEVPQKSGPNTRTTTTDTGLNSKNWTTSPRNERKGGKKNIANSFLFLMYSNLNPCLYSLWSSQT